jgi:hypothetical protein
MAHLGPAARATARGLDSVQDALERTSRELIVALIADEKPTEEEKRLRVLVLI